MGPTVSVTAIERFACAPAILWLRQEYGEHVSVRQWWEECNVSSWMLWVLICVCPGDPDLISLDRANRTMPFDLMDEEPREDLADALRAIFPAEWVEEMVLEWLEGAGDLYVGPNPVCRGPAQVAP